MPNEYNLHKKLGLVTNADAYVLNPPNKYSDLIGSFIEIKKANDLPSDVNWLQAFFTSKASVLDSLPEIVKKLSKSGSLWVAWPKKSSKIESDLSDNIIREIGLRLGLVDTKVVSIDGTWSALKFVYRLADR